MTKSNDIERTEKSGKMLVHLIHDHIINLFAGFSLQSSPPSFWKNIKGILSYFPNQETFSRLHFCQSLINDELNFSHKIQNK
jgi:hypothetical protein